MIKRFYYIGCSNSCLDLVIIDDPFNLLPSFPSHHRHPSSFDGPPLSSKIFFWLTPPPPLSDDIISERPLTLYFELRKLCIMEQK